MTISSQEKVNAIGLLLKYQEHDIWLPSLEVENDTDDRIFYIFAGALTQEEYKFLSKDIGKFEYLAIRDVAPIVKKANSHKVFLDRLNYFLAVKYGPEPTLLVSKEWFRRLILQHDGRYYFEFVTEIEPPKFYGGKMLGKSHISYHIKYHGFRVRIMEKNELPEKTQAMNTNMGITDDYIAWIVDNQLIKYGEFNK